MSPYLLLGFLIAGVLHVFVPKRFYARYLSRDNRLSVVYAALLGVPLPLCSCGVIPTAIGLRNERASKGAVASFLIATPQTGIDSILATFSLMGLGLPWCAPWLHWLRAFAVACLSTVLFLTMPNAPTAPHRQPYLQATAFGACCGTLISKWFRTSGCG